MGSNEGTSLLTRRLYTLGSPSSRATHHWSGLLFFRPDADPYPAPLAYSWSRLFLRHHHIIVSSFIRHPSSFIRYHCSWSRHSHDTHDSWFSRTLSLCSLISYRDHHIHSLGPMTVIFLVTRPLLSLFMFVSICWWVILRHGHSSIYSSYNCHWGQDPLYWPGTCWVLCGSVSKVLALPWIKTS